MQSRSHHVIVLATALLLAPLPACSSESFNFLTTTAKSDVTDPEGKVWHSRAGLEGGKGTSTRLAGREISGTSTPALFTSNVWGNHAYRIPVPGSGNYRVTLYAAEDYFQEEGRRVFHVDAEGATAVDNIDLVQAAGYATAYSKSFTVTVTDGQLDLKFIGNVNNPLISAVRVELPANSSAVDPVITSTPTPPAPSSATPGNTYSAAGGPAAGENTSGRAVGFASNSFFFQDVSQAPLAANSAAQAADLAKQVRDYYGGVAAFNAHQYNVALETVGADVPTVDVTWVDCQKKGSLPADIYTGAAYFKKVPIPAEAAPAVGTDGQLSIYQPSTDRLWEFWKAKKVGNTWQACWGGRIDKVSTNLGYFRESYGVSATNVSLTGGMITLADVRRGSINHAMSVAIINPAPYQQISWPAQRSDGHPASKGLIREGQRFRLDPSLDLSKYDLTPMGRMVAEAAQTYGFIVTDKSGAVAVPTESGLREKATTGRNPWDTLLTVPDYKVLENFPWDKTQFMPLDYGKP
ncbi:MAG TPA: malectin [Candidatus Luteococcus avicola]|nr:malectin [Candidatus Luteococcus avicola]